MTAFSSLSRFFRRAARLALAACMLSPLLPSAAPALESRYVYGPDGSPMFEMRFFGKGEQFMESNEDAPGLSTWTLSEEQMNGVMEAAGLWAEVLGPGSAGGTLPFFNIGTFDDENAAAMSEPNTSDLPVLITGLQGAVISGTPMEKPALIAVGKLDFDMPEHLSPLPSTEEADFVGVLYHEIGHALGVASLAHDHAGGPMGQITVWESHLTDRYGTALAPGMNIVPESEADSVDGPKFVVGEGTGSGVYFHGDHVAEVLGEGNGLLIEGYEWGEPDLSHIELERSLMSHQNYRNYTAFMEAELAALQDIGYSIDRRNFYGFSIYGDGETIVNGNGYFARNEAGDAFLEGVPNTATLGTGLHLYGKQNTVTQAADLLACGTAGTGIRVDGSGNTLAIAPGVRIAANGAWGTGLLVAYGKDQAVISRGDVTALGEGGIAARFDFGSNLLGNATEYRGSWIWNNPYEEWGWHLISDPSHPYYNTDPYGMELNLDGPLVSSFDVSGLLAGSAASLFVSENAFVGEINILSGAQVIGDIVSEWDPENPDLQYPGSADGLHTALTFGRAAQADGTAGEADPSFDMTLYGGIDGAKSINMSLEAGRLAVTDAVNVYSLRNAGLLALYGTDEEGFGASVAEAFVNEEGAVLETGFLPTGEVNGIKAYSAVLGGTWALRPMPGFYAQNALITPQAPVDAEYAGGGFTGVTLGPNLSPTLEFALSDSSGTVEVRAFREKDAYSRYAGNAGAFSLGSALYGISGVAGGDMQALLAALDWSEKSGAGVARGLNLLGPEAWDASARASLNAMSALNLLLLQHMNRDAPQAGEWRMWAAPFGSASRQGAHGGSSGWKSTEAGLLAALERSFDSGLTAGVHLASGMRETRLYGDAAKADSRFFLLGAHSRLAPGGRGGYLAAQARLGLENADMDRRVAVNGYARSHESDGNALLGSFMLGAGWDASWGTERGTFRAGPLAWLEYGFLRREGFTEHGGASALHVDGESYASLPLSLGAHTAWQGELENGAGLGLDITAAWRHELADTAFHTHAHFAGYDAFGFSSATALPGRDALLLQGSLTLTSPDRAFFMQLSAGGEAFRRESSAVNASLSLGWKF